MSKFINTDLESESELELESDTKFEPNSCNTEYLLKNINKKIKLGDLGMPYHTTGLFFCVSPCYLQNAMPCHLMIYCKCYGFESAFFTLLPYTPSCCFQGFLADGSSTTMLTGLHADLQNIVPVQLFV